MHRLWVYLLLHEYLVGVIHVEVSLPRIHLILVEVGRLLHEIMWRLASAVTIHSLGASCSASSDLRSLDIRLTTRHTSLLLVRRERSGGLHYHLRLPRPAWLRHGIVVDLWILSLQLGALDLLWSLLDNVRETWLRL